MIDLADRIRLRIQTLEDVLADAKPAVDDAETLMVSVALITAQLAAFRAVAEDAEGDAGERLQIRIDTLEDLTDDQQEDGWLDTDFIKARTGALKRALDDVAPARARPRTPRGASAADSAAAPPAPQKRGTGGWTPERRAAQAALMRQRRAEQRLEAANAASLRAAVPNGAGHA